MPTDPRRFLIDFLPAERRVLQRDGLHLFNIRYWSDELRRLMGQGDKVLAQRALGDAAGGGAPRDGAARSPCAAGDDRRDAGGARIGLRAAAAAALFRGGGMG